MDVLDTTFAFAGREQWIIISCIINPTYFTERQLSIEAVFFFLVLHEIHVLLFLFKVFITHLASHGLFGCDHLSWLLQQSLIRSMSRCVSL